VPWAAAVGGGRQAQRDCILQLPSLRQGLREARGWGAWVDRATVTSQHDVAYLGLREIEGRILSGSHLYKFYRFHASRFIIMSRYIKNKYM
jgi:hypothetical protein